MEPSFIQNLITRWQSPCNQEYFAVRALQCFATETGPSWLDVILGTAASEASMRDAKRSDDVTDKSETTSVSTLQVKSEFELQQLLASHNDTNLKIFFIRQRNSASRLSINWQLFLALCQNCGIFDRVRDYVMCFGMRSGEAEISPPMMHCHTTYNQHPRQPVALECVYILRFVELSNRQRGNPWSIRQSAIYNSYNQMDSSMTWLFVALSTPAEAQLRSWLESPSHTRRHDPFEIHYLLFDITIGSWRRYVVYLAEEIRQQADRAIVADLETDGTVVTRLEERQYLKQIEDHVTDLVSSLSFMVNNIDVIVRCYQTFHAEPAQSTPVNQHHISQHSTIMQGFSDRKKDLLQIMLQAETLREKVDSASNLVSSILDLNSGNALKALALESRAENANMALLTKKSVQDAAMVKVLTIVTLVYLPVTVVTNFFSTSFVDYTQEASGKARLTVTSDVWILFAASVPLTIFTIYVWWMFAQREVQGRFPGKWTQVLREVKAFSTKTKKRSINTTSATRNR